MQLLSDIFGAFRIGLGAGWHVARRAFKHRRSEANVAVTVKVIAYVDADDELMVDGMLDEVAEVHKRWGAKRAERLKARMALEEKNNG